jgi:aryl-alcohol dehydrogenase-like predicted oxidoreductase
MLSARQTSGRCFEPEYLRTAVRRSLRRFRTDTIDLLMLHEPPLDVIQRGDAMATLTELQSAGDARHVGVCTLEVDVGRAAVEAAGVECIEVPFDVCHRAFADDVIPAAVERGIGVLTVAPLGDGRLVAELPGLTADAAASACLRAALDVPGVAATVVGMNRAEHVPRNVDAIATMPPVDAVERLRAAHCPDRDRG